MIPSGTMIDVHTHSSPPEGSSWNVVLNLFAQDLPADFDPAGFCTIGFHPWHIGKTDFVKAYHNMERCGRHAKVLGIGECGLDKNILVPFETQEDIFVQQLHLSEKLSKPAIIHCVKAYSELLRIRKSFRWKGPWMIHWFNSSVEVATDLIHAGCYLSFGRNLLHPDSRNADVFRQVPPEKIFLETDDAGIPLPALYHRAAGLLSIPVDQLIQQISKNFYSFFTL